MAMTGAGVLGTTAKLVPLPPQAKTLKRTSDGYASNKDRASFIPMPAQNWNHYDVTTSEARGMS